MTNFSFPSMRFNTEDVGPNPFQPNYRNTIGVIAPFSRGPAYGLVTTYTDFTALFGDDASVGSVAVRQIFQQGATNIAISRVLPSVEPATSAFAISHPNSPTTLEAVVGSGINRTIGYEVNFDYISDPVALPGLNLGRMEYANSTSVNTLKYSLVKPQTLGFTYNGFATITTRLVEVVNYSAFATQSTLATTVTGIGVAAAGKVQLVLMDKSETNADTLSSYIRPGLKVVPAFGNTDLDITTNLEVITYAFSYDEDNWGFYVKGAVTGVTAGGEEAVNIIPVNDANAQVYVFANVFNHDRTVNTLSDTDFKIRANRYLVAGVADSFFTASSTATSTNAIKFIEPADGGLSDEVTSGISFVLGVTGVSKLHVPLNFAVDYEVLKTVVKVGQTDLTVANPELQPAAFAPETPVSTIFNLLKAEINKNPALTKILGFIKVVVDQFPATLSFTTYKQNDSRLNNLKFKIVQKSVGTPTDLNYVSNNQSQYDVQQSFSGATSALRPASAFLYDSKGRPLVYIEALSAGKIGNELYVTVTSVDNGGFTLYVEHIPKNRRVTKIPPETHYLSNYNLRGANGLYPSTENSRMIRAYFIPTLTYGDNTIPSEILALTPVRPSGIAPTLVGDTTASEAPLFPEFKGLSRMKAIPLTGGTEPTDYELHIPVEDYLEAVKRLETKDVAMLIAPGLTVGDSRYSKVFAEMQSQAVRSTPYNGLRFVIASAPKNINAGVAADLASLFGDYPAVVIGGWTTYIGAPERGRNQTSPEAYLAGSLAVLSPSISPASDFALGAVQGVRSSDAPESLEELDAITKSRVEVLHYNRSTGTFKYLNGRTTSPRDEYQWIMHLRIHHHVISTIFSGLQWALSANNEPSLWTRIQSSADAILAKMVEEKVITRFEPTVVGPANNTSFDLVNGVLNIRVTYTRPYPADFHNYTIRRVVYADLALNFSENVSATSSVS